jgi:hypothetical protein
MAEATDPARAAKKTGKKRSRKKTAKKPAAKKAAKKTTKTAGNGGRRPGRKPYPVMTFEEVLKIGLGIMEKASGEPVKRTRLLSLLGLSDNQNTRNMITTSGKYGVTSGGYQADKLSLTDTGKAAVDPNKSEAARRRAKFQLAIESVEAFNKLYEKYRGKKLPSLQVMEDDLDEVNQSDRAHCVEIFVQNAKFIGLLKPKEGAEFLYRIDDAVAQAGAEMGGLPGAADDPDDDSNRPSGEAEDFEKVCFFIAPIGSKGDETRKHSDAILTSYVEKALESVEPKLKVVRADKIDQPGMISKQVVEYILKSRLVVADLSYLNPNVFYELALRHATGKPTVHIKRDEDKIPFDTNNFRTIEIKFGDKFDILAELETVRTTIATYARQALAAGSSTDNPILTYCPGHRFVQVTEGVAGG